jgi:murein DD-endopeptidase MepM/ murein hydrolase activator NlpD
MKKLFPLVVFWCLVSFISPVQAGFEDVSIEQGRTLEITFPRQDITSVHASKDGKKVVFYPIRRQPNFDEPISRGEFLELMFKNSDFPLPKKESAPNFPDVPSSHPFYQSITQAEEFGIIDGYQDGNFGPYDPLTRGQIAKILVNAYEPEPILNEAPSFSDIPNDHQFFSFIEQAVRAELFKGYPDGLMRPDRSINFSEAESVIRRAASPTVFTSLGERDYWRAFIGIHRMNDSGTRNMSLTFTHEDGQKTQESIAIDISKRSYKTISFNLAPSKTDLLAPEVQDNTWTLINEAKSNPHADQLWDGAFIVPADGVETLGFGDLLNINGKYSGSHFGLDWANDEGTEVVASNHGIVTLAEWTPSYGYTIIIDHGQNVFTMYLHLSELKAVDGQMVKKGDLIGLMGSTGVATGSHLHFTHFIGDIIVDSDEWLNGNY